MGHGDSGDAADDLVGRLLDASERGRQALGVAAASSYIDYHQDGAEQLARSLARIQRTAAHLIEALQSVTADADATLA